MSSFLKKRAVKFVFIWRCMMADQERQRFIDALDKVSTFYGLEQHIPDTLADNFGQGEKAKDHAFDFLITLAGDGPVFSPEELQERATKHGLTETTVEGVLAVSEQEGIVQKMEMEAGVQYMLNPELHKKIHGLDR